MKWFFQSLKNIKAKVDYTTLSLKNRYPCRLIGEKYHSGTKETTVLYQVSVRRDAFEIKLKDLLNDPILLEKFHPGDAVKLGFLACGEILFGIDNQDERYTRFREVLKKMNHHNEETS